MCVTSMGEVHDHKGSWKDDKTLVFEPFKFEMNGKPATEDVSMTFEGKKMTMKSSTTTADGTMTFSGAGTKK